MNRTVIIYAADSDRQVQDTLARRLRLFGFRVQFRNPGFWRGETEPAVAVFVRDQFSDLIAAYCDKAVRVCLIKKKKQSDVTVVLDLSADDDLREKAERNLSRNTPLSKEAKQRSKEAKKRKSLALKKRPKS